MADLITNILRASGEAPDPALRSSRLAQGFARLILCLTSLQRAEAQVFEMSLADPAYDRELTRVEALWAECAERLDLLSHPPMPSEPALAPIVQTARLMRTWLSARSIYPDTVGAPWLAREASRLIPHGQSRLAWQTGVLIKQALALFSAVTGLSEVTPERMGIRQRGRDGAFRGGGLGFALTGVLSAALAGFAAIAVFPGASHAGAAA